MNNTQIPDGYIIVPKSMIDRILKSLKLASRDPSTPRHVWEKTCWCEGYLEQYLKTYEGMKK